MFVAGTWFRKKAFVATVTKAVKHGRRWKREKHGRRWERDSRALRRVHSTASRRTKSYPESTRETMGSSPQFLGQRTVYTIFGIPGISSSVAATEKNHRFAFNFIGDQTYQGVCFQIPPSVMDSTNRAVSDNGFSAYPPT